MRCAALISLIVAFAFPAIAQENPAVVAKRAAGQLAAAQNALTAAEKASDRVRALTQTIRAYENGLTALREGLRRAAIREQVLVRELDLKRERIMQMVGVLGIHILVSNDKPSRLLDQYLSIKVL